MGVHKFSELMKTLPKARRQKIERRTKDALLRLDLREMRKLTGRTQAEVAAALKITQGQVSLTEQRGDHRLSTLRRYVRALGGELEVVASFGDKQVKLHGV